jgi:hypothetical protein
VSFSFEGTHVTADLPKGPRRVVLHVAGRAVDLTGRTGHVELEVGARPDHP